MNARVRCLLSLSLRCRRGALHVSCFTMDHGPVGGGLLVPSLGCSCGVMSAPCLSTHGVPSTPCRLPSAIYCLTQILHALSTRHSLPCQRMTRCLVNPPLPASCLPRQHITPCLVNASIAALSTHDSLLSQPMTRMLLFLPLNCSRGIHVVNI